MQARGFLNYRLKYCWSKVFCCICQPNELEREIMKKTGGGQTGGQAKIWGGHGPPRPSSESPLFSPYWTANVGKSSGRENCKLHDLIILQSRIFSCNCLPAIVRLSSTQLLNSHTQILVFHNQDRNKNLGHRTENQFWTEKASSKQN